jgi:uncharacterized small protein (DUF1192 family)
MKSFTEWVKKVVRTPSALELAQIELEDAMRELLNAQSATEYAARMAMYHSDRIKRLTAYIKQKDESQSCQ